jgi:lysozyme
MKPRHQASKASVELIKSFEGFRRRAARLPDGSWTIGYGHTRTARQGVEITESDADGLLIYDLATVVRAINEWVYSPLTQNQFDALVAFVFNIGVANFRSSSVLRRLNEGSHLQAACAMEMWRTADFEGERIVIDALVRRRSAEMALFLTPQDGYVPVPSLVVQPRVDDQAARAAPARTAEVEASLDGSEAQAQRPADEAPPSAGLAALEAVTSRLGAMLQDLPPEPVSIRPAPPVEDEIAPQPAPEAPLELASEPPPEPAKPAPPAVAQAPSLTAPVITAPEPRVEAQPMVQPTPSPVAQQVETLAAMLARSHRTEDKVQPQPEPEVVQARTKPATVSVVEPSAQTEAKSETEASPMAFTMLSEALARHRKKGASEPLLALVGLIGMGVFGAGIFWGFSAKAAQRLPLGADPVAAGWGLGLLGVALAASSIYFLLNRLGSKSE